MSFLLSGILLLSSFVPRILDPSSPGSNSGERDVGGQTFDYIIVGGGLTGLTVANRLSEDSSRKCVTCILCSLLTKFLQALFLS
jgi:hypothetical protein